MNNKNNEPVVESLLLELRRGSLVLSVLSQLKKPQYGYSLVVILEQAGINIEAGTLYPLLRRLEKQDLLTSSWDTDSAKPRKYYEISQYGKDVYEILCRTWKEMTATINQLIESEE